MIPAIDESVLRDNPDFAALHHTLTTAVLNPDGSTKNDLLKKERDTVREQLAQYRLAHARDHLLTNAIATATPEAKAPKGTIAPPRTRSAAAAAAAPAPSTAQPTVPDPLIDLLLLLLPLLSATQPLDPSSAALLLSSPPFSDLSTLLPQLAPILSASLHASAAALARIASPATNPSFLHRRVASLAPSAAAKRQDILAAESALVADRVRLSNDLSALLAKHRLATGLLIKSLEGKHGVVARSLELRAAEVGLLARRGQVEAGTARDAVRGEVYPPEAVAALRNYGSHLRDARIRVEEAIRGLEGDLEAYGVGVEGKEAKEARMREMARAWKGMERDMEEVTRDLERLGRA